MTLSDTTEPALIILDSPIKHLCNLHPSPILAPDKITQSRISQPLPIDTFFEIDEPVI